MEENNDSLHSSANSTTNSGSLKTHNVPLRPKNCSPLSSTSSESEDEGLDCLQISLSIDKKLLRTLNGTECYNCQSTCSTESNERTELVLMNSILTQCFGSLVFTSKNIADTSSYHSDNNKTLSNSAQTAIKSNIPSTNKKKTIQKQVHKIPKDDLIFDTSYMADTNFSQLNSQAMNVGHCQSFVEINRRNKRKRKPSQTSINSQNVLEFEAPLEDRKDQTESSLFYKPSLDETQPTLIAQPLTSPGTSRRSVNKKRPCKIEPGLIKENNYIDYIDQEQEISNFAPASLWPATELKSLKRSKDSYKRNSNLANNVSPGKIMHEKGSQQQQSKLTKLDMNVIFSNSAEKMGQQDVDHTGGLKEEITAGSLAVTPFSKAYSFLSPQSSDSAVSDVINPGSAIPSGVRHRCILCNYMSLRRWNTVRHVQRVHRDIIQAYGGYNNMIEMVKKGENGGDETVGVGTPSGDDLTVQLEASSNKVIETFCSSVYNDGPLNVPSMVQSNHPNIQLHISTNQNSPMNSQNSAASHVRNNEDDTVNLYSSLDSDNHQSSLISTLTAALLPDSSGSDEDLLERDIVPQKVPNSIEEDTGHSDGRGISWNSDLYNNTPTMVMPTD